MWDFSLKLLRTLQSQSPPSIVRLLCKSSVHAHSAMHVPRVLHFITFILTAYLAISYVHVRYNLSLIPGLSSTTLSDSDGATYIFWYDWVEGKVYRCNVTRKLENPEYDCRDTQLKWKLPGGEVMVAMMSFDKARIPSTCK